MSVDWHTIESQLIHQDNDKRITALHQLEQLLSDSPDCPEDAEQLASHLKTSLKSNNSHVSTAALQCLPPYLVRLPSIQLLKHAYATLLPSILDKMGDQKIAIRQIARESLVVAARKNLEFGINAATTGGKEPVWSILEKGVTDNGFGSKNAKAREQAILFLGSIREASSTNPLPPLKPFTPLILPLLADSDPQVRQTALSTTIAIFCAPSVSVAAKTDLKRAMGKLELPKKVQDQVLQGVLGGGSGGMERSESQTSLTSSGVAKSDRGGGGGNSSPTPPSGPATRTRTRAAAASTASSSTATTTTRSTSPPPLTTTLPAAAFPSDPSAVHNPASSDLSPVYVASERDLELSIESMHPCFEGKETEHNWIERDRSISTLRGMMLGGILKGQLREAFVGKGIKGVQDGIIKTSSSLRTTLAISSLTLIADLCDNLSSTPHLVDTLFDPFFPHYLSMACQTKKIVATQSQNTVTQLLNHSTYHFKTIQSLNQAIHTEKTVQARQFVASHLITFLRHYPSISHSVIEKIDSTHGTEEIVSAIKKGLTDSNPVVRENGRVAFWEFEKYWGKRAEEEIRVSLEGQQKKLLDKVRPDRTKEGKGVGAAVEEEKKQKVDSIKTRGTARSASGGSTMRELMLAKKREAMAKEKAAAERSQAQEGNEDEGFSNGISTSTPPRRETNGLTSDQAERRQRREEEDEQENEPLTEVESPFQAPRSLPRQLSSNSTPSRRPNDSSTPSRIAPRTPQTSSLSVPESVVDDALQSQALRAEQTAERLLEIQQEEEEDAAAAASDGPEMGEKVTPRKDGAASTELEASSSSSKPSTSTMQTPLQSGKTLLARRNNGHLNPDVFQDSPDPKDGFGGGGAKASWWIKKNRNAGPTPPLPVDSPERSQEIDSLIDSLRSLEIDPTSLRKVCALSRERVVRDAEEEEDERSEEGMTASTWWRERKRFETVYDGLRKLALQPAVVGQRKDMALIALKDLVENQFPCFVGDEAGVFDLLFRLREDFARTTIAATETIATSFASHLEPLYGLGTLCPALTTYLSLTSSRSIPPDAVARSFALGLRLVATFFESLPLEVLEDVFPQTKELIKGALDDQTSGDLRRSAINALVSAQSVLRDEKRLTEMVDGLAPEQANLLSYYCAKRGV